MMRHLIRSCRGYSLLEVLLTVTLLGLLLFAVGDSIGRVLDSTLLGESRQNISRSGDELATRLSEEARSSTAVFLPAMDVLGQPNDSASGAHEVDFYRKGSDGTTAYVAYRFDVPSGVVTRYEYVPAAGGPPQIIHQDQMSDQISAFSAAKVAVGAVGGVVGATNVNPVNIYYGTPEIVGGNSIVAVSLALGTAGEPQRHIYVNLSSRAAPTDISILVASASPTPSPGPTSSPISVGFVINPLKIHLPHGPYHSGDPGNNDPGGGIHGPGIAGTAQFIGNGVGPTVDWLSLYNAYAVVVDGIYSFKNSDGKSETVTISCEHGTCPAFAPNPIPTTGPIVLFDAAK